MSNKRARKRPVLWKPYFGDRIHPVSPGADRNLSKPAAGYGHQIPESNSWHFPAENDEFPEGFRRKFTVQICVEVSKINLFLIIVILSTLVVVNQKIALMASAASVRSKSSTRVQWMWNANSDPFSKSQKV